MTDTPAAPAWWDGYPPGNRDQVAPHLLYDKRSGTELPALWECNEGFNGLWSFGRRLPRMAPKTAAECGFSYVGPYLPPKEATPQRFLLFKGQFSYPNGGWNDHQASFATIEEAVAAAGKVDDWSEWWHVVDAVTQETVRYSDELPSYSAAGEPAP